SGVVRIPASARRHSCGFSRHPGDQSAKGVGYSLVVPRRGGDGTLSLVAQLAEQPAVNRQVVGSSPTGGAKLQVRGLGVFLCSDRVGRYLRKPSTNARLSRAPGRGRPQWRPPSYERLADSPVPSLRERPRRSRSTRVATRGRHGSGRPAQPCVLPWLPTSCDG